MKNFKYILVSFFIIATLIPQLALASWWNPLSWFKKNTKPIEQTTIQVPQNNISVKVKPKSTEKKVSENKVPTQKVKNTEKKSTKEINTPVVSPATTTPTPPVWDVCKNIEGAQSIAPDGLYVDNGNCVPVSTLKTTSPAPIIDLCNNIEGTQSYIPSGMTRNINGNCIVPPTPTSNPVITPVPIIPGSIFAFVSSGDYIINNKGDMVYILATVKDTSGNPIPNQAVIFQSKNSSAVGVTNTIGTARVKYVGDYNISDYGTSYGGVAEVVAKVLIPGTTDTFVSSKTEVRISYVSLELQQGHLE